MRRSDEAALSAAVLSAGVRVSKGDGARSSEGSVVLQAAKSRRKVNNGRMEEFLTNFIPPPILLRTFNKTVFIFDCMFRFDGCKGSKFFWTSKDIGEKKHVADLHADTGTLRHSCHF